MRPTSPMLRFSVFLTSLALSSAEQSVPSPVPGPTLVPSLTKLTPSPAPDSLQSMLTTNNVILAGMWGAVAAEVAFAAWAYGKGTDIPGKVTTEMSTSKSQARAQKDKDKGTSAYRAMKAVDICEDSQLVAKTLGYTCGQINAMYAPACKEYLCPECKYAHYCDSTCGFCTDASATETIHALDTVTETKEISENKPYFGMPVAEPSPSQQTSPHPGTMADEHTQQSHPSEPAEGAREMPNKEGLGIDTRLATEIPKAPESDTGYGTQMEHVADEPVQEHERDEKSEMPPRSDGGSTLERPVQEIKLYDEKTEMPPRSDGGSTLERPVQGLEQDVKPGMALWPRSDGGSSLERPVQELEQNGEKTEPPPRSDEGRSEEPRALVKTSDYSDPEWASLWESLSFKRLKRSLRGF